MGFFGKLLGLFVERVPVDEQGRPIKGPVPPPKNAPKPTPPQATPAAMPTATQTQAQPQPAAVRPAPTPQQLQTAQVPPQQRMPPPGMPPQAVQQQPMPMGAQAPPTGGAAGAGSAAPMIAVVLRAMVPQEYAAHLAPYGLHVLAAGGDVTSDQARGWGAQVLVISAECLGRDLHLLQAPQLPTVFISPQPVMIPEQPGVVQVHEPLHASDVARAVREAMQAWTTAGRSAKG